MWNTEKKWLINQHVLIKNDYTNSAKAKISLPPNQVLDHFNVLATSEIKHDATFSDGQFETSISSEPKK